MTESAELFYLFAAPHPFPGGCSVSTVFYKAEGEDLARAICDALGNKYGSSAAPPFFQMGTASAMTPTQRSELEDALDLLHGSSCDGDEASTVCHAIEERRAYARQAAARELIFSHGVPPMSAEESRNASLNLLLMLAEAYYAMLECMVGGTKFGHGSDPGRLSRLNKSYLWITRNLSHLLGNEPDLRDFPSEFRPALPNLFPSALRDYDWEEMVGPGAEPFLATVQDYAARHGASEPEEGSAAWGFLELFRNGIETAMRNAEEYKDACERGWQESIHGNRTQANARRVTAAEVQDAQDEAGNGSVSSKAQTRMQRAGSLWKGEEFLASEDFRTIKRKNEEYELSGSAGEIIQRLCWAQQEGLPRLHHKEIFSAMWDDVARKRRVQNYFRTGDAKRLWDAGLLDHDGKGNFRLSTTHRLQDASPRGRCNPASACVR